MCHTFFSPKPCSIDRTSHCKIQSNIYRKLNQAKERNTELKNIIQAEILEIYNVIENQGATN